MSSSEDGSNELRKLHRDRSGRGSGERLNPWENIDADRNHTHALPSNPKVLRSTKLSEDAGPVVVRQGYLQMSGGPSWYPR